MRRTKSGAKERHVATHVRGGNFMNKTSGKRKIITCLLLALLLSFALCPMADAYDDDTVIRVGLSYSGGAQPAFNAPTAAM